MSAEMASCVRISHVNERPQQADKTRDQRSAARFLIERRAFIARIVARSMAPQQVGGGEAVLTRTLLRGFVALLLSSAAGMTGATEPATVIVGSYVNQILDLSFKDRRYIIDFWIWFRWKPEGAMADYKPLDSFELINGRIDSKSSIVEKKIGDVNYV